MGRFQGFYTGGEVTEENKVYSDTEAFAKRRQKRENARVSTRQLNIWSSDLSKCSSLADYQNYVKKYDSSGNPCIVEAKQRIDDLTFAACNSVSEYNAYLSSFPSGRNVLKAKSAIRRLQANTSKTTTSSSHNASSHNSTISREDVWSVVKKIIGVVVILPLFVLIYVCINGEGNWIMVGGYVLFIITPVCKWAFDI